jgi:hypothetical protein
MHLMILRATWPQRRPAAGILPSGCFRLAKFFPEDKLFKRLADLWLFGPLLQFF